MKVSIIVPVYNSSKIIPKLLKLINFYLKNKKLKFQVILINDGSVDNSWNIILNLKKKYKFLIGLNLNKNYGQHSAIFAGLKFATGKYIICMDDDLQHHPKYLLSILDKLENGFDSCYVKYLDRQHNIFKKTLSNLNHLFSLYIMRRSSRIYTSSFKGFNDKVKKKIKKINNRIFLDYSIIKYSKSISYVVVKHFKRLNGKSNYGFKQLLQLWSDNIFILPLGNNFKSFLIVLIRAFLILFFKNILILKKDNKIHIKNVV